jgi:hypothetical protein
MMLALLVPLALAGDPDPAGGGVVQVPDGSVVTPPPASGVKPFTVTTYSYLLPEPMYDRALTKAKQLDVCLPALDHATSVAEQWAALSGKALSACSGQFDVDEKTVEDLRAKATDAEARALAAESRLRDVRTQRTVAWAITGGLILGAVTVTAVAVGN